MDNSELLTQISEMMEKQSTELKIFIESQVTKRIDSLYAGYKLNHEKQWDLERKTQRLEEQLAFLQARPDALESKIA